MAELPNRTRYPMISNLRLAILSVSILLTASMLAQTGAGSLKGKVTDANTGEPLAFANVVVLAGETQVGGVATDFDGGFSIKPIPPGTYTVKVIYVGYNTAQVNNVLIKGNKISFQDFAMSSGVNLNEVIVIEYVTPLIDKDGGASGGTVSRADINKMAARSATSVASTVGGVSSAGQTGNNEGNISLRGARSDNTYIYIDGIKVRGGVNAANLPKSAIEEVSVITGGIPANYGDATGGIISITTRGASSEFFGGFDLLSSGFRVGDDIVGLDGFGRTQFEGFLSGPILFKKDENGEKSDPLLGFFLSANIRKYEDTRPSAIGHWYLKPNAQASLEANPVSFEQNEDGSYFQVQNGDFLTLDKFENVTAAKNADEFATSIQAKLDFNLNKSSVFSIGGSADLRDVNNFRNYPYTQTNSIANIRGLSRINSVFNFGNNATTDRLNWRAYTRYTQRFTSGEDSKIKNAFYSISLDYSKQIITTQDRNHKDDFFNYGHVGYFTQERGLTFGRSLNTDTGENETVQNGIAEFYTAYTPGTANPILAGVTDQYMSLALVPGDSIDINNVTLSGIANGSILGRPYGFFTNVGTPANFYRDFNASQFRLTASGTADIGDHALTLGIEYEQRVDRGFDMAPVGLWERARQLTNSHIDPISDQVLYEGYYAPVGDFVRIFRPQIGDISAFSSNLRKALGLDPSSVFTGATVEEYEQWIATNFVDVESLDPNFFDLEMFSAGDLLANGANLVEYYGYDHAGEILDSQPGVEDYFTQLDEDGYRTYAVDAFRPVYISGYIMDKFSFDDIIFNVGVRVDRFDANQKVLKDEYIVGNFYTVGNNPNYFDHPANIGDDYVIYVNDPLNPDPLPGVAVKGYRDGDFFFTADGTQVSDPSEIQLGVNAFPYLNQNTEDIGASAFKDYEPQINVMPRVAFSFPISDEAVFFAHYDVLTQRPERGVRLELMNYEFIQSQSAIINNPSLKPTKTIDYELGFQQVLSRSSSLKISAFYRDMRDMIQVRQLVGAYPEDYTTYRNIDFGTVKGITLAYDLRRTGNTRINANYTLQFASGTGSNSTSGLNLANAGQPSLQNISPLDFDQRHAINLTLDYRYGDGKDYNGPVWFDKQFFANMGLNMIANLGSGTPYSNTQRAVSVLDNRASGKLAGTLNGARLPSLFTLNAQLDKNITLKFGKDDEDKQKTANMNIYLLVNNLLNTKNVVLVYPFSGSAEDDGYLVTPEGQLAIDIAASEEAYADLYSLRLASPYNYAQGRTISLGVKVDF